MSTQEHEAFLKIYTILEKQEQRGFIDALNFLIHDRTLSIKCRKHIGLYKNLLEEEQVLHFKKQKGI